jgi:hypothetical protein
VNDGTSNDINAALPTVVYGPTGLGKTIDVVRAMAAGGFILTPKTTNLVSVNRTWGYDPTTAHTVVQRDSAAGLVAWLVKNKAALVKKAASRPYGRLDVLIDDLTPMCRATRSREMARCDDPNDSAYKTRSGSPNKEAMYAALDAITQDLTAMTEELAGGGVQLMFTGHEMSLRKKQERGEDAVILTDPHTLGIELFTVNSFAKFAPAISVMLQVRAFERCPLEWKGSYCSDRWDKWYVLKDRLNIVAPHRAPQNLAVHWREAGRDVPYPVGYESIGVQALEVADRLLQGGGKVTIASELARLRAELQGYTKQHIDWILSDGYAHAVVRGGVVK